MQIYLPIAEMSMNVFLLLGLGGVVGFLSGLFGVGGGFLMTPLLIFIGIPPSVAVASQANQIVGSSVSGTLLYLKKKSIDFKMGFVLLLGGLLGSTIGVEIFSILQKLGQIDTVISLSYVVFLGTIGLLMFVESLSLMYSKRRKTVTQQKLHKNYWIHRLPFKTRFRRSKRYISILLPLFIGFFVGLLSAIMGVGGGFIIIPAMIYLLGMPTNVIIGTSLFQIIFVTINVTLLQAVFNQTVDVMLALMLLIGAVVGTQYGAKASYKLKGEHFRALLALLVLMVCGKLLYELLAEPNNLFSITGF